MMRPLLLSAVFACAGCVDMEFTLRDPSATGGNPMSPAAIAPPIIADQVTAANARRMCDALWAEMDHEEQASGATAHGRRRPHSR